MGVQASALIIGCSFVYAIIRINLMHDPIFHQIRTRPSAEGTLSRLACARARAAGLDVRPLMAKAGVTRRQVEEENVWLPAQGQIRLVELIADTLQDDFLGFHIARDMDLRELGLLYYVLNSSDLLGDALRRGQRYCAIINEGVCLRVHGGTEFAVAFNYIGVNRRSDRHQIEAWVTSLVRICRELTDRRVLPNSIRFVHRRKGCPEMDAFMGCKVEFSTDADEVAFPGTAQEMPILAADPYLNRLLIKSCEQVRSHWAIGGPFRVRVENAIAPLLPHGKASLAEIAHLLGMSPRTLTRRLAAEGLTFADVLNNLRMDLARHYLQDEGLPISKTAWLLGYGEVSAFTHAHKRWTGRTPTEARAVEKRPTSMAASDRRAL
jgi:AraC-like DNA-binding protein